MSDPNRPGSYRRVRADNRPIVGRLEAHGRANYQFRADQAPSYFVKVLNAQGTHVLWGKDLERAIVESRTQPKLGDQVGVRRTGFETFTIPDGTGERTIKRNQWIVETAQFFVERARLARRVREAHVDVRETTKQHPELVSTYLSLRGAELIAERRIADPKDRERFLALVREAMTKSIRGGAPLPEVRLRDRDKSLKDAPEPAAKREPPAR